VTIALRGLIGAAAIIAGVVLVNLAQIRRRGHIAQGDDALDRAPQAGVTMRQGARS
jgi:drug/metabolite transporter (DMT)-like permease